MKVDEKKSHNVKSSGQAMIEFAFAMIVLLIMTFSTIAIFRWVGVDLAQRRRSHDFLLRTNVDENWGQQACTTTDICNAAFCGTAACPPCTFLISTMVCVWLSDVFDGPLRQIDPYFYEPVDMNAVYDWE